MSLAPELVAPAHLWVPPHISTAGGEAADLMAACGKPLDPEQRIAADAILAEGPGGRWAAFEAALIAPRQNIKTFLFQTVALADLYLFGAELVVWTAHDFDVAMEAFRDFKALLDANDFLSRRVKRVSEQNGSEGIELITGQRLRFKARTRTGGRGLTGDRVILDEAFALQPGHMGTLMPTMSARSVTGNPQILYGSSGGLESSAVLRSIRDRGRPGGDPSLAYIEWCAEGGECATPDCDHQFGRDGCLLDDQERWAKANLALGRRISVEFLATERRSLPATEFAREVLGWWDDPPATGAEWDVIGEDAWAACLVEESTPETCSWSLDVAPDSRSAAIARSDGAHGELMAHATGTGWVIDELLALKKRHGFTILYLDATGPAGSLLNDLEQAGIDVRKVTLSEHAQACVGFLASIDDSTFRHLGQEPLDAAAAAAQRRSVTDVWLWTRSKSAGDICPLVAVTLARWGALQGIVYDVLDSVL